MWDERLRNYYFGNYYGDRYANRGFRPWFDYGARHHDPLYTHYRWRNRTNPDWHDGLRRVYDDRLAGRAPLPPRTLQEQHVLAAKAPWPIPKFWTAEPHARSRILELFAAAGAKVVVAEEVPGHISAAGWQRVGDAGHYAFLLPR